LIRSDSGAGTSLSVDAGASSGELILFPAAATGDWVEFKALNVPAGNYLVKVLDKTGSDRGKYLLGIDGDPVGTEADQYAASGTNREVEVEDVTFGTTEDHTFRFSVTGKNASSTGYSLAIDAIVLEPIVAVTSNIEAQGDRHRRRRSRCAHGRDQAAFH
jgi:hypothetical protein